MVIFSFGNRTMYKYSEIAYQLTTDSKKIIQFSFVRANIFGFSMDSIRRDKKKSNLQTFYLSTIMFICHTALNNNPANAMIYFFFHPEALISSKNEVYMIAVDNRKKRKPTSTKTGKCLTDVMN